MRKKSPAKLKVYLETSFVSYLTGLATTDAKVAADQAWTRKWWEQERDKCDVYVSVYTLNEASRGRAELSEKRTVAIKDVKVVSDELEKELSLARKLIRGHALPEGETTDAMHIASAAIARMDVLLTWNCRHMANPHTLPITMQIVEKAGYRCPLIMTPETFLNNLNMEAKNV